MKYFLLWNKKTNRMLIDTRVRQGWKTEQKTEATSWLEAKKNFGLELTPLQKEILDAKDDRVEIGRRIIRHQQNAGTELWPADGKLLDWSQALADTGECV